MSLKELNFLFQQIRSKRNPFGNCSGTGQKHVNAKSQSFHLATNPLQYYILFLTVLYIFLSMCGMEVACILKVSVYRCFLLLYKYIFLIIYLKNFCNAYKITQRIQTL